MRARNVWHWLGMALVVTGCTNNTVQNPVPNQPQIVPHEVAKKPEAPPKKPSPELCLRTAQLKEALADDAKEPAARDAYLQHAKAAYQQAIDQEPNCMEAKVRLAKLHEKMGNAKLTVLLLQDCIKQRPNDAILWYELGMFYGRQKQWDSSVQCLQKANAIDPGNATYANHLGFTLARAGRFDDSFEYFRAVVGEAQAHVNVAKMMNHVGQMDGARQHAQIALQLDPALAEAQQLLDGMAANQGIVQTSATAPQ